MNCLTHTAYLEALLALTGSLRTPPFEGSILGLQHCGLQTSYLDMQRSLHCEKGVAVPVPATRYLKRQLEHPQQPQSHSLPKTSQERTAIACFRFRRLATEWFCAGFPRVP